MDSRPRIASTAATSGSGSREKRAAKRAAPEHPQRVVAEGDLGVERGAQATGGQVAEAVKGVDQLHLG